jgi:hypothetical protein
LEFQVGSFNHKFGAGSEYQVREQECGRNADEGDDNQQLENSQSGLCGCVPVPDSRRPDLVKALGGPAHSLPDRPGN